MGSREPRLLQLLADGVALLMPQRGLKEASLFVNRQGLECMAHLCAQVGVVKPVAGAEIPEEQRISERSDRIPHPDELDRSNVLHRIGAAKQRGLTLTRVRARRARPIQQEGFWEGVQGVSSQDAAGSDEAREAADGEGTTAEAEQEELVTRLVILDDEAIGLEDVPGDAGARVAVGQPRHP